mmetsp:Transcript_47187/g.76460  ORF Transcript_47187/g.76460 Transcript_47187/m.76460 type:complete len:206 (-) Transcript_47187:78-695(-)
MTRPRFIKMPHSRNRGKRFITGSPESQRASCRTAVSTAARTSVLPASRLNVVRPGECEPMTAPQSPAPALAMPVHFTSSSMDSDAPVELSIPAIRNVSESTNTKPRPKKVDTFGGRRFQSTRSSLWTVHMSQKGTSSATGKSQPDSLRDPEDSPSMFAQAQKPKSAAAVGATAMTRAGRPAFRNSWEPIAIETAQASGPGESRAS